MEYSYRSAVILQENSVSQYTYQSLSRSVSQHTNQSRVTCEVRNSCACLCTKTMTAHEGNSLLEWSLFCFYFILLYKLKIYLPEKWYFWMICWSFNFGMTGLLHHFAVKLIETSEWFKICSEIWFICFMYVIYSFLGEHKISLNIWSG